MIRKRITRRIEKKGQEYQLVICFELKGVSEVQDRHFKECKANWLKSLGFELCGLSEDQFLEFSVIEFSRSYQIGTPINASKILSHPIEIFFV